MKSIIAKTALIETTKWGGPVYVLNDKNVFGIGDLKVILEFDFLMAFSLKMKKRY
ncbi:MULTISPECIES: hypothetical protein [unclassified Flavobacterium]|uniref:hypothetical protein n=1 Tax=unclassified Flavobacterium TaxID=196869 RepID=UPI00352CAC6A